MPEFIQNWDFSVLMSIRSCESSIAVWAAWLAATLAWKGIFFWGLAAVLWLRGQRLIAAEIAVALLLGTIEIGALKGVISRPRPDLYLSLKLNIPMKELLTTAHSFPSGHTTLVAAAAMVLISRWPDWRGWLAVLLVFAVGVARVYQGLHWPTDIAGSIALGVVAGAIAMRLCSLPLVRRFIPKPAVADNKAAEEPRQKTLV